MREHLFLHDCRRMERRNDLSSVRHVVPPRVDWLSKRHTMQSPGAGFTKIHYQPLISSIISCGGRTKNKKDDPCQISTRDPSLDREGEERGNRCRRYGLGKDEPHL